MEALSLGVQSINCILKSAAKSYGFDIFTYDPKTGLVDTMKRKDSLVFLKTIIRDGPGACKNTHRYIDVIIKSDPNAKYSNNKSDTSRILSQANECVEEINDQGFLFV